MIVRTTCLLVLLAVHIPAVAGQTLGIGDPAPPLAIAHWVKGDRVDMAIGRNKTTYVLEFWATWCGPCLESIGHMTELQHKYKDKNVVMIGITDENKSTVERFVRNMGGRMDYHVACDKPTTITLDSGMKISSGKTNQVYMFAAGQDGIPTAFIINREGRVAWMGSPFLGLDEALEQIVAGTFDLDKYKAQHEADSRFMKSTYIELMMAMQFGSWDQGVEIARAIADPANAMSNMLKAQVLSEVAWMLVKGKQAPKYVSAGLEFAQAAYEASEGANPIIMDTYSRALFENGKVNKAIEIQRKAIEMAQGPLREELQKALKEYEAASQGKP